MNMRTGLIGCTLLAVLLAGGCVERTLSINSNPSGALVYLDDQEIGRTPLKHDFTWYATYDVTLRQDGYYTVKSAAKVKPPIYQWVPLDLFAEILPIPFHDTQTFNYDMTPEPQSTNVPALLQRGQDMREELQGSQLPPATRPATR